MVACLIPSSTVRLVLCGTNAVIIASARSSTEGKLPVAPPQFMCRMAVPRETRIRRNNPACGSHFPLVLLRIERAPLQDGRFPTNLHEWDAGCVQCDLLPFSCAIR